MSCPSADPPVGVSTRGRVDTLVAFSRASLLAFIEGQGVAPDVAEDVLHHSLLSALRASPELRDGSRLIPWFYRIVRNAVRDTHRRRTREHRAFTRYAADQELSISPREETVFCRCFRAVLPKLKAEDRVLIEEIELEGRDPEAIARRLGITRNNLNVRRHRARQHLRELLETLCTLCSHDRTDCGCPTNPGV